MYAFARPFTNPYVQAFPRMQPGGIYVQPRGLGATSAMQYNKATTAMFPTGIYREAARSVADQPLMYTKPQSPGTSVVFVGGARPIGGGAATTRGTQVSVPQARQIPGYFDSTQPQSGPSFATTAGEHVYGSNEARPEVFKNANTSNVRKIRRLSATMPSNWGAGLGQQNWDLLDEKAQYAYTIAKPDEQIAVQSALMDGNTQLAANVLSAVLARNSQGQNPGQGSDPTKPGGGAITPIDTGHDTGHSTSTATQSDAAMALQQQLNELKALDASLDTRVTALEHASVTTPAAAAKAPATSSGSSMMPLLLIGAAGAAYYYFNK